jgi:hypothetical protein
MEKDEAGLARSLPSSPLTFPGRKRRGLTSSSSSPTSGGEQRQQKQSIKSDSPPLSLFFTTSIPLFSSRRMDDEHANHRQ